MNRNLPDDLQFRILALLDGTLEEEEVTDLDAELRDSPEARVLFRQLAALHSALEFQGLSQADLGRGAIIPMELLLAELSDDTPPGPPNSVTSVGLSWNSAILPEGLAPGAPLAIEITPNQASGADPGYLDLDNVRVTVVGE